MSEFGIGNDLIKIIMSLYNSVKSSVLLNNQIGTDFNTTVCVIRGCLLSAVLFSIVIEEYLGAMLTDTGNSKK